MKMILCCILAGLALGLMFIWGEQVGREQGYNKCIGQQDDDHPIPYAKAIKKGLTF